MFTRPSADRSQDGKGAEIKQSTIAGSGGIVGSPARLRSHGSVRHPGPRGQHTAAAGRVASRGGSFYLHLDRLVRCITLQLKVAELERVNVFLICRCLG